MHVHTAQPWQEGPSVRERDWSCISGMYVEQPEDLMSLINGVRGYRGVSARGMSLMARLYDPEFAHRANPLAWPLDL